MNSGIVPSDLESRAADTLKALLSQVSGIKLKEMKRHPKAPGRAAGMLVDVDVFGHSHTLACEVNAARSIGQLRMALREMERTAAPGGDSAIPILIAPCLSPEAQDLCKQFRAGFVDLAGNARLFLGELFISMRSMPCRAAERAAQPKPVLPVPVPAPVADPGALRPFPIDQAPIALIA